jgi:hypothetical protein
MVLFFLTRAGFEDLRRLIEPLSPTSMPIWLNQGVLTDPEVATLRQAGASVTCFTSPIDLTSREDVDDALAMIALHHPGGRIWVETCAETVRRE